MGGYCGGMGRRSGHDDPPTEDPRLDRYRRALACVLDDGHPVGFLSTWVKRERNGGHDVPHCLLELADDAVADFGTSWLDDDGEALMDIADFDRDTMTSVRSKRLSLSWVMEDQEPELWAEEYAGDQTGRAVASRRDRLLPVSLLAAALVCLAIGSLQFLFPAPWLSSGFAAALGIANGLIGVGFLVAAIGTWSRQHSLPR